MTYTDFQQRVIEERKELFTKRAALDAFITSNPVFKTLTEDEQGLLENQRFFMTGYINTLDSRIWHFNDH